MGIAPSIYSKEYMTTFSGPFPVWAIVLIAIVGLCLIIGAIIFVVKLIERRKKVKE